MRVLDLKLKNFRNIDEIFLCDFEDTNVICGENAQGKTNLLEAIWLFTGLKSFRGSKDNEFLKFGTEKSELSLSFISEKIENDAKIEITERRNATLNNNKLKTPSLLAGKFNAVIFSPADIKIVSEGPAFRRKFLDVAIGQLFPSYIESYKNYVKAVSQRNSIIKDFKYDPSLSVMLDIFEEQIAEEGEKIITLREKYISFLNEPLKEVYSGISRGKEKLSLNYLSTKKENLIEQLKISREKDIYTGSTSVGPHREDLEFKIDGVLTRSFASQGQKRSVALSLKLAEAEVIKKYVGEWPIFLLDDVMSELDPFRQEYILNHIEGMQSFITCCDPSNTIGLKKGKIITVKEGKIV